MYTCAYMYTYTYIHIYIYMCICFYLYAYICSNTLHIYVHIRRTDPREGNPGGDDARGGDDVLLVAQELRALVAVLREQRRREPVHG